MFYHHHKVNNKIMFAHWNSQDLTLLVHSHGPLHLPKTYIVLITHYCSIPLFSPPIFSPYFCFCNNLFTFLDMNNMFPFLKRFFKVIRVMFGSFISIALIFFPFLIQNPNAILDKSHQYCQFWKWSKPPFNCTPILASGWNVSGWKLHFFPHSFLCFLNNTTT